MNRTHVRILPAGRRALLNSHEVAKLLADVGETVADRGRRTATVDTGEYRDGIHVESVQGSDTVEAHILSSAPHAPFVEARTGNLVRAIQGG